MDYFKNLAKKKKKRKNILLWITNFKNAIWTVVVFHHTALKFR